MWLVDLLAVVWSVFGMFCGDACQDRITDWVLGVLTSLGL